MTKFHAIPLVLVGIAFVLGACSNDVGDGANAVDDVGIDTNVDVDATVDTDVSMTDSDLDVDTDSDTTEPLAAPWEDCDCPNPEEKCTVSNFCGLPHAECGHDVNADCPAGYTCQRHVGSSQSQTFVCVCIGEDEKCVSECDSQADCPESWQVCSFEEGVCRWRHNCSSDMNCPDGFLCNSEYDACEPTGDLQLGEPCEEDIECHSGICAYGYCDEQCLTDDDCSGPDLGEPCNEDYENHCEASVCIDGICQDRCDEWGYCVTGKGCNSDAGGRYENGCQHVICEVSCPPGTRCSNNECLPQYCTVTGDCESGDCVIPHYDYGVRPGHCVAPDDPEIDRYCKPDERRSENQQGTYCFLPGPCWEDDHCDEPYSCESGHCRRWLDDDEDS